MESIEMVRAVFNSEINAINEVKDTINGDYEKCISRILECNGRIIIVGVGKPGRMGKKIVATFASTGIPSFFELSTEAVIGILACICNVDVVLAISIGGKTRKLI